MQGGSQEKASQGCKGQFVPMCHLQALSGLQIPGHLQHQIFNDDLTIQHVNYMHLVPQQACQGKALQV